MTIELNILFSSADGNNIEIVPRDVTGISDVDQLPHLEKAKKSQYSRLFIFGREPSKGPRKRDSEVARDYPSGVVSLDDLKPFNSFKTGVYILINTRLTQQNRHSIFVGIAGIDFMSEVSRPTSGVDLETIDADRELKLFECLKKKSEKPPKNMGNWDLAIVIPTQGDPSILYETLCYMLSELKEFLPQYKLPRGKLPKVYRISPDYHGPSLLSSMTNFVSQGAEHLIQGISAVMAGVGPGLLIEVVKTLLWKWSGRRDSASSTSVDQSIRPKTIIKMKNSSISTGDVINKYEITNINIVLVTDNQTQSDNFDE